MPLPLNLNLPDLSSVHKLRSRLSELTPKLAASFLERNHPRNRNMRMGHVATLAKDMEQLRYYGPGTDGIGFDTDGWLVQGQHRCRAVVKTGVTILVWIVEGLTPETIHTLDCGATRSASDSMHIAGVEGNTTVLTSTARTAMLYEGLIESKVSRAEQFAFISHNPDLTDAVNDGTSLYRRATEHLHTSIGCAALMYARRRNKHQADLFFTNLQEKNFNGEGLTPVLALDTYVENAKKRGAWGGNNNSKKQAMYMVAHAFTCFRKGQRVTTMKQVDWREF